MEAGKRGIDTKMEKGIVYRLSISAEKGQKKQNVPGVELDIKLGIIGDAHGATDRPVSLLPFESFSKLYHPDISISPGDFAENITTTGLGYSNIRVGTVLRIGENARLEVVQIGKECHDVCPIKEAVGDCIMPREGVFARVIKSGAVKAGDSIEIETN